MNLFKTSQNQTIVHEQEICNPISTGVILILDIIPSLIMKSIAPWVIGYTRFDRLLTFIF